MPESKRWAKKFVDKRDWKPYNEELVVRGEFLLSLDWVRSWNNELRTMNRGKSGSPFRFPESLIKLQAVWHQLVDYRSVEGITRKLAETGMLPEYDNYSTVQRRVTKLELEFELPTSRKVYVSCDGSGMKSSNSGEYMQAKYGRKMRNYVKVVITADPFSKCLIGCEVHLEGKGPSEPNIAILHLEKLLAKGVDVEKFWGDGSFDVRKLFKLLDKHGIECAIKIRENASIKARGCIRRRKEVLEYKEKGYKRWAKDRAYGQRWTGTEGIFSAVKRKFRETTRASKLCNMFSEVKRKFWVYQNMRNYAHSKVA